MPPTMAIGWNEHPPASQRGVRRGDPGAERHTGHASEAGQEERLAQELDGDLAAGRTQGPAQSDLPAPLEHRDHHHVGDSDSADEEGDCAETEEQAGQRRFGSFPSFESVAGTGHLDLVGVLRIRRGRQHASHVVDESGVGAGIQGGGDPLVIEEGIGGLVGNESSSIEVRRQG